MAHQLSVSPPETLPFTAFSGPSIRAAGQASSGWTAEREIHAAVRPVDLELVDPGTRLAAVGGTGDVQADEAGFNGRLDDMGGHPRTPGVFPDALAPHRPGFPGRRADPLLHVVDRLAFPDAVHQRRLRQAPPGKPLALEFHVQAVPEEDQRREGARARRPTARVWRRRRGAARSWRSSTPAAPARRRKGAGGPRYSPPIRYSYRASTFSSAGSTPSMRWPSSAIRPSARANCSRSRVITSMPSRSSFSLISVT